MLFRYISLDDMLFTSFLNENSKLFILFLKIIKYLIFVITRWPVYELALYNVCTNVSLKSKRRWKTNTLMHAVCQINTNAILWTYIYYLILSWRSSFTINTLYISNNIMLEGANLKQSPYLLLALSIGSDVFS